MLSSTCPCGRPAAYADCCGALHTAFASGQGLTAATPEALMRSRYSAFVLDRRDYLLATWHPSTRPATLEPPEPGLKWLGLEVKRTAQQDDAHGTVEFVARSKLGGRAFRELLLGRARADPSRELAALVEIDVDESPRRSRTRSAVCCSSSAAFVLWYLCSSRSRSICRAFRCSSAPT